MAARLLPGTSGCPSIPGAETLAFAERPGTLPPLAGPQGASRTLGDLLVNGGFVLPTFDASTVGGVLPNG